MPILKMSVVMAEQAKLPTERDLKKLSLRAIVAYAARAAQRVRLLFDASNPKAAAPVDRAIEIAVNVASANATCAEYVQSPNFVHNTSGAAARAAYDSSAGAIAAKACNAAGCACSSASLVLNAANGAVSVKEVVRDAVAYAASAADNAKDAAENEGIVLACRADYEELLKLSGPATAKLGPPIDFSTLPPI